MRRRISLNIGASAIKHSKFHGRTKKIYFMKVFTSFYDQPQGGFYIYIYRIFLTAADKYNLRVQKKKKKMHT